jgi:hypothetical protein
MGGKNRFRIIFDWRCLHLIFSIAQAGFQVTKFA